MANLGVSELMTDPDFVDTMTLITARSLVSSRGENMVEEQSIISCGSVQPASGRTIDRLPQALRVANVSSFWFKGVIEVGQGGKTRYPSLFLFRGQRYRVQVVFDWSNWGEGYCEGTCVAENPA
jgi:hypothetical protein